MTLHNGSETYDSHQMALIIHLGKSIKKNLSKAGIKGERLKDLAETLTFDVAALLDGSETIKEKRKTVRPFVTFAMDPKASKLLVDENGSYMHEYVYGLLDEVFE